MSNLGITNKTGRKIPSVPFAKIKNMALGRRYSLSLVFIGGEKSKELNKKFRGKNKPTNVLSFTIDKNAGEIFITPSVLKKQTTEFCRSYKNLLGFLFIHGLMHLKGMEHGSRMDRAESVLRKRFKI